MGERRTLFTFLTFILCFNIFVILGDIRGGTMYFSVFRPLKISVWPVRTFYTQSETERGSEEGESFPEGSEL